MNPWAYIGIGILLFFGVVVVLTFVCGIAITTVGSRYSAKTLDKYAKRIEDLLPGKNCGECSSCKFPCCADYAAAVLRRECDRDLCKESDDPELPDKINDVIEKLNKLMEDPTPIKKRRRWTDRYLNRADVNSDVEENNNFYD